MQLPLEHLPSCSSPKTNLSRRLPSESPCCWSRCGHKLRQHIRHPRALWHHQPAGHGKTELSEVRLQAVQRNSIIVPTDHFRFDRRKNQGRQIVSFFSKRRSINGREKEQTPMTSLRQKNKTPMTGF